MCHSNAKCFSAGSIGLLLWLTASHVQAAPPDAGALLQELRPEPIIRKDNAGTLPQMAAPAAKPVPSEAKVLIRTIQITGAQAIPQSDLYPLVADAIGHELSFTQLDEVAMRITRHYRQSGYLVARAYLPAQEIRDGAIRIAVLEGQIGEVRIDNRSQLADRAVNARLGKMQAGQTLLGDTLEREMLLLSDLPGVEVRATLKPGASVGTTDLDVQLADKSPYAGSLELDNFGNRHSGEWRLGGNFTAGNLTGHGDTLALRAIVAQGLGYGRLAWQLPVGSAGTQAGVAASAMRYTLGSDFAVLAAHGSATIGSLYLLHPFVRSRTSNIDGQLLYDHKRLQDDIDSTATHTRKSIDLVSLGLSASHADAFMGGGVSSWSLAYTTGHLDLDAISQTFDQGGHQSAGGFGKLNLTVGRIQGLLPDWHLAAVFRGQKASKNLDSAEKMSLGGPDGVRAYPQGEISCDDAWFASLELRRTIIEKLQASIFYDTAGGHLNHSPIPADSGNVRRLRGYGIGLTYADSGFSAQLTLAWPDATPAASDIDRKPRAWFQATKRF